MGQKKWQKVPTITKLAKSHQIGKKSPKWQKTPIGPQRHVGSLAKRSHQYLLILKAICFLYSISIKTFSKIDVEVKIDLIQYVLTKVLEDPMLEDVAECSTV